MRRILKFTSVIRRHLLIYVFSCLCFGYPRNPMVKVAFGTPRPRCLPCHLYSSCMNLPFIFFPEKLYNTIRASYSLFRQILQMQTSRKTSLDSLFLHGIDRPHAFFANLSFAIKSNRIGVRTFSHNMHDC